MQKPNEQAAKFTKPRSTRPKRPNRKGTVPQKLKAEDLSVDEGYHSGNPPPLFATHVHSKPDSHATRSSSNVVNVSERFGSSGPNGTTKSTMNKQHSNKVVIQENQPNISSGSTTAITTTATTTVRAEAENDGNQLGQANARPKLMQRSESRTFVFIYDEDAKTSKPVTAPDNLNVDVPVLLQYGLTEDAIEKCLDKPDLGTSPTDEDGPQCDDDCTMDNNNGAVPKGGGNHSNGRFCPPTERLLRSREKDEMKNKGMHVVKWLVGLDKNDKRADTTE